MRVSGFLDQGVDVERCYDVRSSDINNFQHQTTRTRTTNSNFARRVQQYPNINHATSVGRDRDDAVNNNFQGSLQIRNNHQEFNIINATPRMQQESLEMEPLISECGSHSYIRPLKSGAYENRRKANAIRKDATQVVTHNSLQYRIPNTHQESSLAPSFRQDNDVDIDDEEGDIVCCDDCYQHESTKNICTLIIWATLVFFIMNRFFVHMSKYLHQEEDSKIVDEGETISPS